MALTSTNFHKLFFTVLLSALPGSITADPAMNSQGFCQYSSPEEFQNHWRPLVFPNIDRHTQYKWVKTVDNCYVYANANASASGLIYKTTLDLTNTPNIHWSWKINHTLQKGDSSKKSGDDYAARIYIAFESNTEQLSWLDKIKRLSVELLYNETLPGNVINYLWANKLAINETIPNAYIGSSMMIAVQSGNDKAGTWQFERRNLLEDYQRLFGEMPPPVIGIAIMTDTDNTGESAEAWYGPIYFD